MKILRYAIAVACVWCIIAPQISYSAPARSLTAARSEYLRLKNIDPTGLDPAHRKEWEALASRMRAALASGGAGEDLDSFRVLVADSHLRLYRSTKQRGYLQAAKDILAPALSDRGEDGDGTALILMGDIVVSSGDVVEGAERWYEQAAELAGPVGYVARQRLAGLQNGTYKRLLPSRDLEVPRIVRSRHPVRQSSPRTMIVLDPGHGGSDAGAIGVGGAQEKEITLDIARRVKAILEKRYGFLVTLTRKGDEFVPLARRTAFANKKEAAAFVSLHVNASAARDADGFEAYYLDNTNDEASRKLAERENGIESGESVDDLSFMLSDLIQSGKMEDSIVLTRSIEGVVRDRVVRVNKPLRSLGVKKAPFFVLVGAHMPCALIEMFFVDHPTDGAKLKQDSFRSALANGIADGIRRFVEASRGGVDA